MRKTIGLKLLASLLAASFLAGQVVQADISRETLAPPKDSSPTLTDLNRVGASRMLDSMIDEKELANLRAALKGSLPRRLYRKIVSQADEILRIMQNDPLMCLKTTQGGIFFVDGRLPALERLFAQKRISPSGIARLHVILQYFSFQTGKGLFSADQSKVMGLPESFVQQAGFREPFSRDLFAQLNKVSHPGGASLGAAHVTDLMEYFLAMYQSVPFDPEEFKAESPQQLLDKTLELPAETIEGQEKQALSARDIRLIQHIVRQDPILSRFPEMVLQESVFANMLARVRSSLLESMRQDENFEFSAAPGLDKDAVESIKELLRDFRDLLKQEGYASFEIREAIGTEPAVPMYRASWNTPLYGREAVGTQSLDITKENGRLVVHIPTATNFTSEPEKKREILLALQQKLLNSVSDTAWRSAVNRLESLERIKDPLTHAKSWRKLHVLLAMKGGLESWRTLVWLCSYMPEMGVRLCDAPYYLGEGLYDHVKGLYYEMRDKKQLIQVPITAKEYADEFRKKTGISVADASRLLVLARHMTRSSLGDHSKKGLIQILEDAAKDDLFGEVVKPVVDLRTLAQSDPHLANLIGEIVPAALAQEAVVVTKPAKEPESMEADALRDLPRRKALEHERFIQCAYEAHYKPYCQKLSVWMGEMVKKCLTPVLRTEQRLVGWYVKGKGKEGPVLTDAAFATAAARVWAAQREHERSAANLSEDHPDFYFKGSEIPEKGEPVYEENIVYEKLSEKDELLTKAFAEVACESIAKITQKAAELCRQGTCSWQGALRYMGANLTSRKWEPGISDFLARVQRAGLVDAVGDPDQITRNFHTIAQWYSHRDAVWAQHFRLSMNWKPMPAEFEKMFGEAALKNTARIIEDYKRAWEKGPWRELAEAKVAEFKKEWGTSSKEIRDRFKEKWREYVKTGTRVTIHGKDAYLREEDIDSWLVNISTGNAEPLLFLLNHFTIEEILQIAYEELKIAKGEDDKRTQTALILLNAIKGGDLPSVESLTAGGEKQLSERWMRFTALLRPGVAKSALIHAGMLQLVARHHEDLLGWHEPKSFDLPAVSRQEDLDNIHASGMLYHGGLTMRQRFAVWSTYGSAGSTLEEELRSRLDTDRSMEWGIVALACVFFCIINLNASTVDYGWSLRGAFATKQSSSSTGLLRLRLAMTCAPELTVEAFNLIPAQREIYR